MESRNLNNLVRIRFSFARDAQGRFGRGSSSRRSATPDENGAAISGRDLAADLLQIAQ
jgi:hypothetical protein